MNILTDLLFNNQDVKYREFSKKLIPDTKYPIIGVRAPIIKNIAKSNVFRDEIFYEFINDKHLYYEEYLLHGMALGYKKLDFDETLSHLVSFLPYIDNWAICDSTVSGLKIFKKNLPKIFEKVKLWIKSDNPYTVRFAIVTLLNYFLGENFSEEVLNLAFSACCEHYYINMAIAWLISVALVKNYPNTVKLIESKTLPKFVQNKSIQKAVESFRISTDVKEYLKTFKV